jgi:hypothetical protein
LVNPAQVLDIKPGGLTSVRESWGGFCLDGETEAASEEADCEPRTGDSSEHGTDSLQ